MEKRNVEISLDTAKEWYQQGGNLKEVALQAFSEEELKRTEGIKVWEDLGKNITGYFIDTCSTIRYIVNYRIHTEKERNLFCCEKQAKSALAMAQISQLLPYYNPHWENGIPDWSDKSFKDIINSCKKNEIEFNKSKDLHFFLAFETENIARRFYRNNKQLVKDYLMID